MAKNLGDLFIDGESIIEDENGTHTIGGTAGISTSKYKYGSSSVYFDGSKYLSITDHEDFNFGSGDFTIDFWLNLTTLSTTNGYIVYDQWYSIDDRIGIIWSPTYGIFIYRDTGTSYLYIGEATADNWEIDVWKHVAITRVGNNYKVYIDGEKVAEETLAIPNWNVAADVYLGRHRNNPTAPRDMYGYLDNFRITKGTALWTSNFNLTETELLYTNGTPYVRPDTASGMYKSTLKKGNRGKAAEGYIRPTIKEFFMSDADFEEIESVVEITSDTFEDLDDWDVSVTSGSVTTPDNVLRLYTSSQSSQAMVQHKGVLEGEFDFTVDYFANQLTAQGSSLRVRISSEETWIPVPTTPYLDARILKNFPARLDVGTRSLSGTNHTTYTDISQSSKFRFKRESDNRLHAFVWRNSTWAGIHSAFDIGSEDLYLILYANCWGNAHSTIGKFDNLNFTSGSLKIYP